MEKGVTEDEMVGWHHWLNGHEFQQAPGDGGEQGSLASCRTEQLNNDSFPRRNPNSRHSHIGEQSFNT